MVHGFFELQTSYRWIKRLNYGSWQPNKYKLCKLCAVLGIINHFITTLTQSKKRSKFGRSKPHPVLTGGFNRLKPPWSICLKVVNTGQYESEWSIEHFKGPF